MKVSRTALLLMNKLYWQRRLDAVRLKGYWHRVSEWHSQNDNLHTVAHWSSGTTRDGKEPSLLAFGSVRFYNVSFLHCKIAYTTEENVCFALLNRIMYWNHVMSILLQSSPLILHKSCLPVHATHITSNVTLNYQLVQTTQSKLEMGNNPYCSGSVLFYEYRGSVRFYSHL